MIANAQIADDRFVQFEVKTARELHSWLKENHGQKENIWLVTFKKSQPENYVSTSEVLDELIAFGWIDGVRKKLDTHRTMQLISPRKTQHWTRTYKERAKRLEVEGRMQLSGLQAIEFSKQRGLWDFMDDVDNLIIPKDLESALQSRKEAYEFFRSINDSSKRFVLRWLKLSKTDKTRNKRILQLVDLSARGE